MSIFAAVPPSVWAAVRGKDCAFCGSNFQPQRMGQKVCSPTCARRLVNAQKKQEAERKKLDRMMDRAAKEGMKTIPQLKKEAQVAFNAYIRERDRGLACISCGAPEPAATELHAGRDAGHYRSTGAADHLRFDERNCHAQCVHCNQFLAGNVVAYRAGLVARIGLNAVEALEADNTPIKWTREVLREIKVIYRAKAREQKRREQP